LGVHMVSADQPGQGDVTPGGVALAESPSSSRVLADGGASVPKTG
jgi:hypothetical protein